MTLKVPALLSLIAGASLLLGRPAPSAPAPAGEATSAGGAVWTISGVRPLPSAPFTPPFRADTGLALARLRYDGGGDWYADPSSLPNLTEAIRERTGIPVVAREVTVALLDPALRDHPYLYMTGHGNVRFSADERAALRAYLLDGGFLHADDNYGMDEAFRREIRAVFPEKELVPIPPDHPVFHAFYDFPDGLPKIHEHDGEPPEALGIFHRGRLLVFYSHESDLGDGWESPDVHDDPPELREQALRMGVNLFLYALGQAAP